MNFFEIINKRASVRSFEPAKITDEEILQICDAGRKAPSAYNRQPWEFIVIQDRDILEQLSAIQSCVNQVDTVICVVVDAEKCDYWKEAGAISSENMFLAIVALGYSSLYMAGPEVNNASGILNIPKHLKLVTLLPIGLDNNNVQQDSKKPLNDILHYNQYGNKKATNKY